MRNVIPLSGQATRCGDCRHAADCPLTDATGTRNDHGVNSRTRVCHGADRIHSAGKRLDSIYRVRSGWVKTTLTAHDGDEQVTGFYGPGEWLGLDALDEDRHRSDAVALDTVSVCVMPLAQLREHMSRSPRATTQVVSALSGRLARSEHLHLILARDGAAQRLAGFLMDLCHRREAAGLDTDRIELPMSRGEIASYLALAVETVSRLLTRLQRAGMIEVYRHHLLVLDRAGLATVAGVEPTPGVAPSTARSV